MHNLHRTPRYVVAKMRRLGTSFGTTPPVGHRSCRLWPNRRPEVVKPEDSSRLVRCDRTRARDLQYRLYSLPEHLIDNVSIGIVMAAVTIQGVLRHATLLSG